MMKHILLGGAALIALPAIAQTSSTTSGSMSGATTSSMSGPTTSAANPTSTATGNVANSMSTTTNDHSMHSDNVAGTTSTGTYSQVNGGVTSSSTGSVGTAASDTTTDTMDSASATGTASSGTSMASGDAADPTMSAGASTTADGTMTTMNSANSNAMAYNNVQTSWNFGGDMGRIGSADFGVNRSASATGAVAGTGVGGPIDIDGQWSSYAGSEMNLTPLQFGTWMLEANGQDVDRQVESTLRSRADNLPAIQVLNVTAGAFAAADADNDHRVSRAELQSFAGV